MNEWIVVTDFDGTLTEKDVGNELCKLYRPQEYKDLSNEYNAGVLTLRDFQQKMWTGFPTSREVFSESALRFAKLRPGVNEFLELCAHKEIPVYIASCGIDAYIEPVIERYFSKFAQAAIKGMACNKSEFSDEKLAKLIAPNQNLAEAEPLHKGRWARELGNQHARKVVAIGNGGSDRTFIAHVDKLFATEKLPKICAAAGQEYTEFEHFFDILRKWPLA